MFKTDHKKFYNLLRQKYTNEKKAQLKKKQRTFGNKSLEKRFNTMKKLTGSKTSATKIPVWKGDQYLTWRSQR